MKIYIAVKITYQPVTIRMHNAYLFIFYIWSGGTIVMILKTNQYFQKKKKLHILHLTEISSSNNNLIIHESECLRIRAFDFARVSTLGQIAQYQSVCRSKAFAQKATQDEE